jgi:hypothetical protein
MPAIRQLLMIYPALPRWSTHHPNGMILPPYPTARA